MDGPLFTILQQTIFDIVIPTSDVCLDISFAFKAFSTENYGIGCLILFPVLLNMLFTFYKWESTDFDTKKEKQFTWLLVILCVWPQYQVVKVILSICRGKSKDVWKPMQDKHKNELSYIEPVVEGIPELFILQGVFCLLLGKQYQRLCPKSTIKECVTALNHTIDSNDMVFVLSAYLFSEHDNAITDVFGKTTDLFVMEINNDILFRLNIFISVFSSIKNIVDYLHNGPLKLTSSTKWGKAVVLSAMIINLFFALLGKLQYVGSFTFGLADFHGMWVLLAISAVMIVLPGLFLIGPLARVVGLKKYTRMILKHPELLVLPIVTEYVPGPIDGGRHYPACCRCCKCWRCCTWSCCCKGCEVIHTNKIVISKEISWGKMLFMYVFGVMGLYHDTMTYINTNVGSKLFTTIIGGILDRVCFGITLHYRNLKFGVLIIDDTGDVRSALKQELDFELQKRINLKV